MDAIQQTLLADRSLRMSRRAVVQAGSLGLAGLGLPALIASRSLAASNSATAGFGRAKRCLFLFMWGGPSQLETFDPKPDAAAEIRGEFNPIDTCVPGIQISEHFTHLARQTDKLAVIRSLHHTDPAHLSSGHATLTGHWAPVVNSDRDPPSDKDTPHMGAVLARKQPAAGDLPTAVTLPWKVLHPAAPGGHSPGQHGGWLGKRYDPFVVTGDPSHPQWAVPELTLRTGVSVDRLKRRAQLKATLDQARKQLHAASEIQSMNDYQRQAFELLASPRTRNAFDLAAEPDATRDRYGRNIHGQSVLLARRLLEHGVPLVSVNWHQDGKNFWDTHGNNFNRLKNDLIPPADRALSALLEDLDRSGLLDDTIVAWVGEFGRKPQISKNNAGREHWPFCYSGLLAGGGIRGGVIHGASDQAAAYPVQSPVLPTDYAATIYHALGIDPHSTLPDRLGRPVHFCQGKAVLDLFA